MITIEMTVDQLTLLDPNGIPLRVYTGQELYHELFSWITWLQIKKVDFKIRTVA